MQRIQIQEAKKDNSLAFLNLLRILGALTIAVIFHNFFLADLLPRTFLLTYLHDNSKVFVEMFFIISGMLFFLVNYNKLLDKKYTYGNFIAKKAIKIYPLVIITTLFVFLIDYVSLKVNGEMYRDGTTSIPYLIICLLCGGGPSLFTDGHWINGPAWYLTVLLFCYLLAALLTFLTSKSKKKIPFLFAIPVFLGLGMFLSNTTYPFLWNIDISRGLIFFFLGIYLMMFLKVFKNYRIITKNVIRIVAGLIIIAIVVLLSVYDYDFAKYIGSPNLFYGLLFFPVLIILCYDVNWLNKLCATKPFAFLGGISYEVYLLNYPIHATLFLVDYKLRNFARFGYWFILFDVTLHIVLAILLHYFYTKKITSFLQRKMQPKLSK